MRNSKVLLLQLMQLQPEEAEEVPAEVAEAAKAVTEEQLRSMMTTTSHLCDEEARRSKFRRKVKKLNK